MFSWFEKRLDPFPAAEPVEPPKTLVDFCVHYTRGAWPYIILDAILVAAIAFAEVWMFGFLGRIVDWLSAQNRETFLQTESWKLAGMAFIVLFALPGTVWVHSLLNQQTLMGNYPMRGRIDHTGAPCRGKLEPLDLRLFPGCLAAFCGHSPSRRTIGDFVPATICPCALTRLDKNGLHA